LGGKERGVATGRERLGVGREIVGQVIAAFTRRDGVLAYLAMLEVNRYGRRRYS